LNGPEIPIIDGSSGPFVDEIAKAGIVEQEAAKTWYTIDTNISFFDGEKKVEITALPAVNYQITTLIDFNSPVLGTQHASLKSMKEFQTEIIL
jgi:UDP-3-O-[3-hydroxymyristoyl] N-acetylglucosamine deacetylase/3-hydroxyacyl-[acyl-carrier-protein] dehydratase